MARAHGLIIRDINLAAIGREPAITIEMERMARAAKVLYEQLVQNPQQIYPQVHAATADCAYRAMNRLNASCKPLRVGK
jgi:hypothetical protein